MQLHLQLSDIEKQMMQEVFNVFQRYSFQTRKFGVHLSHSHFPLEIDEILFETHNKEKRELLITTKKDSEFVNSPLATAWEKNMDGDIVVKMLCCDDNTGSDRPEFH